MWWQVIRLLTHIPGRFALSPAGTIAPVFFLSQHETLGETPVPWGLQFQWADSQRKGHKCLSLLLPGWFLQVLCYCCHTYIHTTNPPTLTSYFSGSWIAEEFPSFSSLCMPALQRGFHPLFSSPPSAIDCYSFFSVYTSQAVMGLECQPVF